MSAFVRKIIHLPGTRLTPEVVLHRTLTKVDHIKAVIVIIQWDDDSFDTDYSQMTVSEMCMAARKFDKDVDATMFQGVRVEEVE